MAPVPLVPFASLPADRQQSESLGPSLLIALFGQPIDLRIPISGSVAKSVKQWKPEVCPNELKYRDSLIAHLHSQMRDAKIEPEYRHMGTTIDIYVKADGFWGSSEVFLELKRNLESKSQFDRLVGQIESLEPKKHPLIVVLCGKTNPVLLKRLRDRYKIPDYPRVVLEMQMGILVKEHA